MNSNKAGLLPEISRKSLFSHIQLNILFMQPGSWQSTIVGDGTRVECDIRKQTDKIFIKDQQNAYFDLKIYLT